MGSSDICVRNEKGACPQEPSFMITELFTSIWCIDPSADYSPQVNWGCLWWNLPPTGQHEGAFVINPFNNQSINKKSSCIATPETAQCNCLLFGNPPPPPPPYMGPFPNCWWSLPRILQVSNLDNSLIPSAHQVALFEKDPIYHEAKLTACSCLLRHSTKSHWFVHSPLYSQTPKEFKEYFSLSLPLLLCLFGGFPIFC